MKKIALISVALLTVVASVWLWVAMRFKTSWETVDRCLPTAVEAAGWNIIEARPADGSAFPLSTVSRIRQILHPQQAQPSIGFPNSMTRYLLERERSHVRVQCLVRYYEGMVLQIGVQYPATARQEAISLRGVLRRTFPGEYVSVSEITEAQINAEVNRRCYIVKRYFLLDTMC